MSLIDIMSKSSRKINIGCGTDYRCKWINLDFDKEIKTDVFFDLREIKNGKQIPFKDKSFDLILLSDVLEHFFNPIPILEEMVRICKIGGIIEIKVPYGENGLRNIDHKRLFILGTFDAKTFTFRNNSKHDNVKLIYRQFYTGPSANNLFGVVRRISYGVILKILNYFIKKRTTVYDMTILRCLFPNTNIHVKYRRVK